MNNFRHHHPKSFGGRGSELPNPWMTEEELANMRRQNPQYHNIMYNLPPNMHSPLFNQGSLLQTPNKNFMNQNSCKMSSSNFTRAPNQDIFKSPHMNETNYPNRFVGNRFPNNSFSHLSLQQKMNDGAMFKDLPVSNMISPQSHKNDGFSESVAKPLYTNMRQPQERFACLQNDQAQFISNSRGFQEKGFPFPNDKEFQPSNHTPFNDNMPASVGSSFSYKSNYRAPSLFPAYTPKDGQEETKSTQHSGYDSNFVGKSNTFCEKSPVPTTFGKSNNFCDKSPLSSPFVGKTNTFCDKSPSTTFSKPMESFQGKVEAYQERNTSERVVNELFPPHSTTSSYMYDKPSLKTMFNSQSSPDSLKTLEDPVTLSSSKYTFTSESQQSCFQSSSEPFHRSENMQMSNQPSTTASRDCLVQSVPFSSQSDVHQNMKESFSSFNFESNINTTDIADLLPGLDAFLKENLQKQEEVPKNDLIKSSSSNCAFSDDEWSKHSIPFIGDNQASNDNIQNINSKDSLCEQTTYTKEGCNDKFESKSEKMTELKASDTNQPISSGLAGENLQKSNETPKVRSALEEVIEMLGTNDAIVGLDYITEYKKNLSQRDSFSFRCKLCNSAIIRPSIIDHILGSKHRMRYLKIKDESRFEYIISLKVEKSVKDTEITKAAFEMEKMYGRGNVTVDNGEYQKDTSAENSSKDTEEGTVEPVFTLDKIPIGFEALSPQHEEMNAEFSLESNLIQVNEETSNVKKETANSSTSMEVSKDLPCSISSDSALPLPGLGNDSSFHNIMSDSKCQFLPSNLITDETKVCNSDKGSDAKLLQHNTDFAAGIQVKRSLSPEATSCTKIQKTDTNDEAKLKDDESKLFTDTLVDQRPSEMKIESFPQDTKEFNVDILENLSESTISSEDEASVVLAVINMLMEKFLRYKLQHHSLEKVEKLMKSLQTRSSENIEDLSSLLKDCKMIEIKNEKSSTTLINDITDNMQLKSTVLLEDNSERQVKQEVSSHLEKNPNACESDLSIKNVSNNSGSDPVLCTEASESMPDVGTSNTNLAFPQNSELAALDNATELTKRVADINSVSQSVNSQVSSSVGLKPPPFFSWPQTSEAVTNPVSYATTVQGNQNMMWTSPYQHNQSQYAQLPYYQPLSYGSTFSGSQAYPGQFSVLPPQNYVPMKMAQPPLPPPPPPPPPAPGNPPLPPLPNSPMYPSPGSSKSVPMPANPPACMPIYSKQPPLPPS